MAAIAGRSDLQLQVIASGTMMLERFGSAVRNVRDDGFTVDEEIYIELEGSTPPPWPSRLASRSLRWQAHFSG